MSKNLLLKLKEALTSVLPITIIVLILHFTIAPMSGFAIVMFIAGAVMLVLGMGVFSLGVDLSMMPMGEQVGGGLTKTRKLWLMVIACFIMGALVTIAEPDLQVLGDQVPAFPREILIGTVAIGVGIFLVVAMLRIVFQVKMSYLLIGVYALIFAIAAFAKPAFLPVAFDSGGVTTGPITTPFIIALGIGIAAVRGGKSTEEDSFGLVGLCSAGPILAVLILGLFFDPNAADFPPPEAVIAESWGQLFGLFGKGFPLYFKEVLLALLPIGFFFILFQVFMLKLPKRQLGKIGIGFGYTVLGLVLFLTGVNVAFLPAGKLLGETIAKVSYNWILIPIGMVIGFFIVAAEPAVHVLNDQVEDLTNGAITKKAMLGALSIGMSVSLALAMTRVLTGVSIWYFLVPGYVIALILSLFVPQVFTAVAFDSGGVASGPMTATFLLPFAMGACEAVGGNLMTDAFGIVAMVAMTPLITVQIMGLIYQIKLRKNPPEVALDQQADDEIIDLTEEAQAKEGE